MTMISKHPMNEKIKNRVFEIFLNTLAGLTKPDDINKFLDEFLSPTEKIMLSKRLSIGVLLAKGYDFKSISRLLKVSPTTITDINLWIKHNRGYFRKITGEIIKKENNREFWVEIEFFLNSLLIPGTNWRGQKKQASDIRKSKLKPF